MLWTALGARSAGDREMSLDINTLFLVTIYVEAMLGLLLLFAWVQNPAITAVAWWGFAHLLLALSVVLFGAIGAMPDLIAIDLSSAILFTAFAAMWIGARVFDGGSISYVGLLGGAALWLAVCQIPFVAQSTEIRFLLSSFIITGYTWATAYAFWHGRSEPLVSRWPAIFMFFANGALFLLRTPLASVLPWTENKKVFDNVWLTVLSFEALLFTIAIAFILLAMAKERVELLHKRAALIDSLTGIANRRAFLEGGVALARRVISDPRPIAVLLIDLDRFKSINDSFGHAIGDRVLQIFATMARGKIREDDLIGRLGGEEFGIALYDADHDKAMQIAETIRATFAGLATEVEGHGVNATCSIGVSVSEDGLFDLSMMLGQADQALYTAKERGRNRCELAPREIVLRLDSSTPSLRIDDISAKIEAEIAAESAA
jgi:diguanylate cyclase (GGDEF)-like protein